MQHHIRRTVAIATAGIALSAFAGAASATMFQYRLGNHPDGSASAPGYGFRLDELFDATPDHDIFTFDFDHASSNMQMDVDLDAGTLRLHGQARGGRDIGSDYAADQYLGLYSIDMMYNVGVGLVPGDDDIWVTAPSMSNWGFITTPSSDLIVLTNNNMGGYTLRIGDEDDDLGHRGFDGISGWGWVNHGADPAQHVESSDWLFTASPVPTPGAAVLASIGLGVLGTARRRRS